MIVWNGNKIFFFIDETNSYQKETKSNLLLLSYSARCNCISFFIQQSYATIMKHFSKSKKSPMIFFYFFSSGKSFPMNTELTLVEATPERLICNWNVSTCTTMKPRLPNTSLVLSSLTWSPEPWTLSVPDLTARSSAQTTLFSDKVVPEITGLRDITQKVSAYERE